MTSRITALRRTCPPAPGMAAGLILAGAVFLTGCSAGATPATSASPASPASLASTPAGGADGTASSAPEPTQPQAAVAPSEAPTSIPPYKPADAAGKAQNVPVPVLPEAAKAETKEGLEAFARYWFELLSYGYETGDTTKLRQITSSACSSCERAQAVIAGWNADGRWLAGGRTDTPSVSTTFRVAEDGNYQVAIQASQVALTYFNSDGSVHKSGPKPEDTGNLMLAVFRDGAWYVNNIQPILG